MAHIYVNEVIKGEFESYLIQHGKEVSVNGINTGIKNYFDNAWEYNPALHGKIEKPAQYVSVAEITKWFKDCRNGRISALHVVDIPSEDIRFYLTYAPDYRNRLTDKERDLCNRLEKLCEMSTELNELIEARECYLNVPDAFANKEEWLNAEEEKYQNFFSEIVREFGQ